MTEGVTPEVFKEAGSAPPPPPGAETTEANKEVKKEEAAPKNIEEQEEKGIVYRAEVTNEQKMKYFKVPMLGCYMAIPLIYKSCLYEEALESSIADYIVFLEKTKKNQEEIKAWEEKCAQLKAEKEERDAEKKAEKEKEAKRGKQEEVIN